MTHRTDVHAHDERSRRVAKAEREACARQVERTAQALADRGKRLLLLSLAEDLRKRPERP